MNKSRIKKMLLLFGVVAFISFFVLKLFLTDGAAPAYSPDTYGKTPLKFDSVIYVLGGSQRSLESRFQKASVLYQQGAAKEVLILSRKGNTEFSPSMGRNLTNDEWATNKLVDLGVERADIEAVSIPERFWGTYNEATAISDLVLKRGYRHLMLVTSPYHAERVRNSFEKFLRRSDVKMDIYLSDDRVKQSDLILEQLKLMIYNSILLPFLTISFHKRYSVSQKKRFQAGRQNVQPSGLDIKTRVEVSFEYYTTE